MDILTFEQLTEIEYVLIFDYVDQPLFFVGESNNKPLMFYFVDENKYLFSPLEYSDFERILGKSTDRELLSKLFISNRLKLMEIIDETTYFKTIDGLAELNEYLPKNKFKREFDLVRDTRLSKLSISDFRKYNTDKVVISMHDKKDSNILSLNVFDSLVALVRKYGKELNNINFTDFPVQVIAPEKGSFKIGFMLDTKNNESLFENEKNVNFSLLLDLINNLNSDNINEEIVENEAVHKILPALNKYYQAIKSEEIYSVIKTSTNEVTLRKDSTNFEKNIDKLIASKTKEVTEESFVTIIGDIKSANTAYNHFILEDKKTGFTYKGRIEKELFSDLKSKKRAFKNYPSEIQAELKSTITYEEGLPQDQIDRLEPKYVLVSFID